MPVRKLTAAFWKTATASPGAERTVYWDAGQPSFGLMVTAAGHRSGVVQYRANGVSRRYTLPHALGLEGARRQARAILGQAARGQDPVLERRKADATGKNTLRAIAERYLHREGDKLRTTARRKADLERLIYPALGDKQIDAIRRSDIVALLDDIEDQRGSVMADQALKTLRRILNWHASRSDDFRSPIVRGMARIKPQERARTRILTDDEMRGVWRAAEGFPGPWKQFIQILLLTAARRNEVADMTWGEISGDEWTIPAGRYKTGASVTLPLSSAAMKVLSEIPRIGEHVFTTGGRGPIRAFSHFKLRLDLASEVRGWALHDLRRTARSLMSRAGVPSDHAERCLGHVIPGIRGVYDQHSYLLEMRQAFEALAAQIAAIVGPPRKQ